MNNFDLFNSQISTSNLEFELSAQAVCAFTAVRKGQLNLCEKEKVVVYTTLKFYFIFIF